MEQYDDDQRKSFIVKFIDFNGFVYHWTFLSSIQFTWNIFLGSILITDEIWKGNWRE